MMVSEAIKILQKLMEENGDAELVVKGSDRNGYTFDSVDEIGIWDEDSIYIQIESY